MQVILTMKQHLAKLITNVDMQAMYLNLYNLRANYCK